MSRLAVARLLFTAVLLLPSAVSTAAAPPDGSPQPAPIKMKITVGSRTFSATLENNETAAAFRARLPLTLAMHDVNENEKAFELPAPLPSADLKPRSIHTGDLMLWRSRTVVLFYQNFSTNYRYTRLGRLDDPAGLAEALGRGDVTVQFELP